MTNLSNKARLSGGFLSLGEAEGIAPERTRYPGRATLLSGRALYHTDVGHPVSKCFVIDLETAVAIEPTINANYNHDSGEVVGYGENFRVEDGALLCDAFIVPFRPGDRAEEIVYRSKNGTQYGTSIEFTQAEAGVEELADGEITVVNGIEVEGPAYIYRNVIIDAFAVTPGPCDQGTDLTLLKQSEKTMTKKIDPKAVVAKAKLQSTKAKLSDDESGEGSASKYPDLDELRELFGSELGVQMFSDGVSIEEARKVCEFCDKYGIVPKPADEAALSDDPPKEDDPPADPPKDDDKEDEAELKATVAKLTASNAKLSGDLAKLTATLTAKLNAEPDGVSSGHTAGKNPELSDKDKFLHSFSERFASKK